MDKTAESYDVIVVGARVAGAATAMLLARQGVRVLLVDRGRYGTDTLSTHALMRGGVQLLSKWDLIGGIIDAGTPPVRLTRFDYGYDVVTIPIKPRPGVEALYAPRRTVLDRLLVDAATNAGADVRFGVRVAGLRLNRDGRVIGVHGRDRAGSSFSCQATLTVGADGINSTVARETGAATVRVGRSAGTVLYGYWQDLPAEGYEWFYRPGHSAGIIPTNAGETCVFAGMAGGTLPSATRAGLQATYHRLLAEATGNGNGFSARFADARAPRRLRTWVGRPSFVRQACGPGWALVGDAGCFLDPLSTHGITDALRDAALLARSIAGSGTADPELALFSRTRDLVAGAMLPVVDRVAGYRWSLFELRRHLLDLSSAMSAELDLIAASDSRA